MRLFQYYISLLDVLTSVHIVCITENFETCISTKYFDHIKWCGVVAAPVHQHSGRANSLPPAVTHGRKDDPVDAWGKTIQALLEEEGANIPRSLLEEHNTPSWKTITHPPEIRYEREPNRKHRNCQLKLSPIIMEEMKTKENNKPVKRADPRSSSPLVGRLRQREQGPKPTAAVKRRVISNF